MALQNFVSRLPPAISAVWLNVVDALKFTVFDDATTKAAAKTALQLDPQLVAFGTDSGAANAAVVTLTGPVTGYVRAVGSKVNFTAAAVNTGAATLNVNGTGAAAIVNQVGSALTGGELSLPTVVMWTGTQWRIVDGSIPVPYARTAAETAAAVVPVNYLYLPDNLLRYGTNTTPGTTDMTTAFQNMALASATPYVPSGTYLVTASINVRASQHWTFDGAVINITGTTLQVIVVPQGINDWSIRGSWSVVGDNNSTGSTSGTAAAINIIDSMRFYLEGLIARNIKGWGIRVSPGAGVGTRAERGIVNSVQCYACYIGIEVLVGTSAEYLNVVSPNIVSCNTGMIVAAGNCNVTGGDITDCLDCVYVGNGANHAHGTFTGLNINHATNYCVRLHQVTNGHTFTGCHIYEGDVWFDRCAGVTIRGGIMDPSNIYNDIDGSSSYNYIVGNWWPGAYLTSITTTTPGGLAQLVIMQADGPGSYLAGVKISDPTPVYVNASRAAGSTQSLTSGVAATLVYNTEAFDRRTAYNNATGVFTVPAGQAGVYRIRSNTVFGGTAMDPIASYIEVMIDGAAKHLFTPSIFSTTKLTIVVDTEVYLNAAQTVSLRAVITGTTPVFGDATYLPVLSIERL